MKIALVNDSMKVYQILFDQDEDSLLRFMSVVPVVVDISDYDPEPKKDWIWDGQKLVDPLGSTQSRKITKLGLRQRFTFSELIALTTAAQTQVPLQVLLANLQVATFIDLNRADTIGGMNLMVSMGLLTPERASQILNNPITESERYKGE